RRPAAWQVRFGVGNCMTGPPVGITERYAALSSWDDDAATRSRHEPLGSTILQLSCLATDRETDGLSREPRRASARQRAGTVAPPRHSPVPIKSDQAHRTTTAT